MTKRLAILLPHPVLRHPDEASAAEGSSVAGIEGFRGVLTQPGHEGISLFVPESDRDEARRALQHLAECEERLNPDIDVLPLSQIEAQFASVDWLAVHNNEGPSMAKSAYVRGMFSDRAHPITCMQYGGLSHQPSLARMLVNLILTPTLPCDALICASEYARTATAQLIDRLREELVRSYSMRLPEPFQIRVVPHGVPTDLLKPRNRQETRVQLELPRDRTIVLYMGRVDPSSKSDVLPLLRAFQTVVAKHGEKVVLLMVGNANAAHRSEVWGAIQALGLSDNVIWRSDVPKVSVPLYYAAADIFVSLSDVLPENFGLTPVEAMSSGLPVVVADWAGYKETVVHGETGFRVPTSWCECDDDLCLLAPLYASSVDHYYLAQSVAVDVDAAAHFLDLLVGDTTLRTEMGRKAREHAVRNFDSAVCADRLWSLWHELDDLAASCASPSDAGCGLQRPRYFADFGSAATRCLAGSEALEITERGRRVCNREEPLMLREESRRLLRPAALYGIARHIQSCGAEQRQVTLRDLEELLQRQEGVGPSVVRRHVMWLLKYGLVRAL